MAFDSHMHINHLVSQNIHEQITIINNNSTIESVINVGLNVDTSKETLLISESNPKFYSAVGIHPLYIDGQNINSILKYADNPKVVAIGEICLDNKKNNLDEQIKYLIQQIIIANEIGLPVIIHSNNLNKIVIEIFEKYEKPKYGCVFHCFQPNLDDLHYLIYNGYYISFAGRITYKTAKKSIEVAKLVPNDLFLVETNSPYISPEPLRGEINKSENIHYIIEKLAEVKDFSYEKIEDITTQNVKRLFKKIK